MPKIFKNPNLDDYFLEHDCSNSLITEYEAGKVISLPSAKFMIDHDFWAGLPVDGFPGLKKTFAIADGGAALAVSLAKSGVPSALSADILRQSENVLEQALPVYERLFEGYVFNRRKIAWRLNVTLNENLHVDAYQMPVVNHFARMFINLDTQPRIWTTGFTLDQMYEKDGVAILKKLGPDVTPAKLHEELNTHTFGLRTPEEWWNNKDKHVIYFDPGDVWVVDSRIVSHQIFYGRRALSIDFGVDPESMQNPRRHYLAIAEDFISDQQKSRRGLKKYLPGRWS